MTTTISKLSSPVELAGSEELNSCLMGWKNLGFEVSGSVCDVSKRAQRERPMEIVSSVFDGKLNILVSTPCRDKLLNEDEDLGSSSSSSS
ncbi:hypothetical protein F8388_015810 [Cannabis sativa]|uniref:Uncharacterized protein n=1 Tax=Cannabis sativa TaxID=3483 RepID=A0A7J6FH30_CANSA|nr:hypothetical protein F8388_015810 [Cannabis sativa]